MAVDRFAFTFDAGRVTGDKTVTLQCKAVYPDGVKTKDIAIAIKEDIPEPVFTLAAPAAWDGRATIEVVAARHESRGDAGQGRGRLEDRVERGAVRGDQGNRAGKTHAQARAEQRKADGDGDDQQWRRSRCRRSVEIAVTEPKSDPWVARIPAKDEKPEDGQFYARDDKGEGTLYYNGTLAEAADSVFLKLYADDKLINTETAKPAADKSYALSVKLKPGLIKYKVEFGTRGNETVLQTVGNSSAAMPTSSTANPTRSRRTPARNLPPETNEWIRSYGRPSQNPKDNAGNLWCLPVWKAQQGEKAELGWWGMELAKRLVESQKVPIFMINAAVGGTRIDQHQRNPANPTDLTTIYGRMLWRVQQAKLTHGIRGILWHQGENDQGADGPTGGYGWETYHPYFIEMAAGWKTRLPERAALLRFPDLAELLQHGRTLRLGRHAAREAAHAAAALFQHEHHVHARRAPARRLPFPARRLGGIRAH